MSRIGTGLRKCSFSRPDLPSHHEPRVLEDAEVLHDAEPGHLQLGLQLRERAAVTREEPVEQEPPRRVRERLEDQVVVSHANDIGDQMVTCQPLGLCQDYSLWVTRVHILRLPALARRGADPSTRCARSG